MLPIQASISALSMDDVRLRCEQISPSMEQSFKEQKKLMSYLWKGCHKAEAVTTVLEMRPSIEN